MFGTRPKGRLFGVRAGVVLLLNATSNKAK
jgi:hypothetical protein